MMWLVVQHLQQLISHANDSRVCGVFQTISPKPMQLGSPDLTYTCFMMSPGNQFLWSKGQVHNVCVGLQTMLYCRCCCKWFHHCNAPRTSIPMSVCHWMMGFPGMGFCTVVHAGFSRFLHHSVQCNMLIDCSTTMLFFLRVTFCCHSCTTELPGLL